MLDWHADRNPTVDYKISLRLVEPSGNIRAQVDEYPIGALLPPTTWKLGDRKPGHLSLGLPADLLSGRYSVQLALYDPNTLAPVPHTSDSGQPATIEAVVLAFLHVDDTYELFPVGSAE